jgi:hypothetical protein
MLAASANDYRQRIKDAVVSALCARDDVSALVERRLPNDALEITSCHRCAARGAYRDSVRLETLKAEHINSEVVRTDAFSMKGINATHATKKVSCGACVKLIFAQRCVTSD